MDNFEYIDLYFNLGMNYSDILKSLAIRHGVTLSKRHLIKCGHAIQVSNYVAQFAQMLL